MLLVTRSRGLFPPPPRRCRRRRPLVGHLFVVAEHLRVPHPGGGLRRRKAPLQRTGVATEGCHFCTVASFYPLFVKFCTRPCVTCCCHSMPPTQTAKKMLADVSDVRPFFLSPQFSLLFFCDGDAADTVAQSLPLVAKDRRLPNS